MRDFLKGLNSIIDDTVNQILKGEDDMDDASITLEEWLETNTDGPNGTRLQRFRRTKNQMERDLTREESFQEYIKNRPKTLIIDSLGSTFK
jgi:hypothetical protein